MKEGLECAREANEAWGAHGGATPAGAGARQDGVEGRRNKGKRLNAMGGLRAEGLQGLQVPQGLQGLQGLPSVSA